MNDSLPQSRSVRDIAADLQKQVAEHGGKFGDYRASVWKEAADALLASSESRESEGYPGIAHDLETMRGVLAQVESYRMDCRCSMKERDSGHHVDCHVPEFQALQDMARNALKNAAPQVAAPVRGNDWRDYPRNAREAGFKE